MTPEGSVHTSKGGERPTVLPNCDAYEPQQRTAWGTITLRVQYWHIYLGSNQQLSDWIQDPLNRRKILLYFGNLANYSGQ